MLRTNKVSLKPSVKRFFFDAIFMEDSSEAKMNANQLEDGVAKRTVPESKTFPQKPFDSLAINPNDPIVTEDYFKATLSVLNKEVLENQIKLSIYLTVLMMINYLNLISTM